MTTSFYNIASFSRFNLSESESDIHIFIKEYKERIKKQLSRDEENIKSQFVSFAERRLGINDVTWLQDNEERYIRDTANKAIVSQNFLSACGFIYCMLYIDNGESVIVGHSSGLIQMRHGSTGVVLSTLRNIQFPPKPIYALEYSKTEERICYAACMDGAIYRVEIPLICAAVDDPPQFCIRADPALECLNMQFYGTPGILSYSTPFVTQRSPAVSLGLTADQTKMVVGYGDSSIKLYDMETQESVGTYKVHKLRLQFIPKKLQRMHFGQVCALRCHDQRPFMFASAAWDKTLRIWDTRCTVGCVMTFEGVNVCSDSIDLNREHCLTGSWQTTEALAVWDLTARKKLNVVRVQNRRLDIDGEYIYACRYWNSTDYNRKGKYAIIGGSGTNCLEVINLHNRYITCSYPAAGTILTVSSYQDRIAFGGTATTFNIVKFFDPKHEHDKYEKEVEPDYDFAHEMFIFNDSDDDDYEHIEISLNDSQAKSVVAAASANISKIL